MDANVNDYSFDLWFYENNQRIMQISENFDDRKRDNVFLIFVIECCIVTLVLVMKRALAFVYWGKMLKE